MKTFHLFFSNPAGFFEETVDATDMFVALHWAKDAYPYSEVIKIVKI
jgi:hypothetical protein